MTRRTRLTSTALALALATSLLPAHAASAQDGTPLRPAVAAEPDPNPSVVLRGRGWGHSVGMSQYGAYAMARAGRSGAQILAHYYPGTSLATWSPEQASGNRVTVRLATGAPINVPATAVGGAVTWEIDNDSAQRVVQPNGATWRVVRRGSDVVLQRGGEPEIAASRVEALLSPMDTFQAANERLSTYNPAGERQYAYGRMLYVPRGSGLAITNRLPLEGYVRGLGEVPSSWGGPNGGQTALAAQAIIARGYVLGRGRDICATPACQVFVGYSKELDFAGDRWAAAVRSTEGRYLQAPGGGFADTFYSSSHGGRTEAKEDSWAYGGSPVSYLPSVDDPWSLDAANPLRSWTAVASNAEFRRVTGLGLSRVERVQIRSRTAGGSPRVLAVSGPEGTREFSTTPTGARTDRSCNRAGYAGNSLRCDLVSAIRRADGQPFAGAGGRPPSSQIRSIGFAPFSDDDGNVHEYATVWANEAGIAMGTAADLFAPRTRVTREQMASFVYRTFDIPRRTEHTFADVTGGPHVEAIASVAAAGIAMGYDPRRFGPHDPVTREQMASFLVRAMGLAPVAPDFDDVPRSGTHADNIGAIARAGITAGCAPDRYCPQDPVLRDQMTSFLHRTVRSLR